MKTKRARPYQKHWHTRVQGREIRIDEYQRSVLYYLSVQGYDTCVLDDARSMRERGLLTIPNPEHQPRRGVVEVGVTDFGAAVYAALDEVAP